MQADPCPAPDPISAWYRKRRGVKPFHHRHGGRYAVERSDAQGFMLCLHGVSPTVYAHLHRN